MDGAVVILSSAFLVCAVILGTAAGWIYWKTLRPARLLRGALLSLADDTDRTDAVASAAARRLARAAAPLAACAGPLEKLTARIREMDRQLHDESVNLQTILGGLSEGVLVVDRSHKVRLVNDGLRRMFDLRSSPLNRSLLEVFRHHDVQNAVFQALDGGEAQTRALMLSTRQEDGRYAEKHFDLTAAGLLSRGGSERPVGAIAIFHDVTRLKALENVRQEFVANVSHELRTPLSIINGYLETLLEDGALEDPATARRFLEVMAKHGQRLNLLVEDLLTLSELENARQGGGLTLTTIGPLHLQTLDLRPCVERVVERLAPVASAHGITLRVDAPPVLRLQADGHRLDQAIFNLLDNALKYGLPALVPEIDIHVAHRTDDPHWVEIAVTDHGPGIPLSDQGHVFERFYRVHKDRSREAGGTGLGLSIVKHIAQAHGGSVTLESRPGHGATFRLRLPAAREEDELEGSEPPAGESGVEVS